MSLPARIVLPVPFPIGTVNTYLLPGDPVTLVDSGPRTPEALAALEAGLAQRGLRLENVELLLLTHHHVDHAGLAATVRERSGCVVAAHGRAAQFLRELDVGVAAEAERATDLLRLHGAPGSVIETVATATEIALRYSAPVEVDLEVDDGDNVLAGGRELRAHVRPGHSSADLVLTDDTGWAIVGDHLLLAGATPLVADDGGAEAAAFANVLRTYRTSLTATAAQGLTVALAGHGDLVEGPAALIATRLAAQDRRVERLRDAFDGAPQTAWELVESVRRGRPFDTDVHPLAPAFIALADVLAYLGPLAADTRIHQVEAGNGTIAFEPL